VSLAEVPPGSDHRTLAWLRDLRDLVIALEARVPDSADEDDGSGSSDNNNGIVPVADTAAVLASNAGPVTDEDAYTTVTPSAPTGARYAEILFRVNSTDNADDGDLKCKGAEGIESPILCECIAGTDDARDGVIHWVALDDAGAFQYKFTNSSTTSIEWSVTYMGYSL